MRVCYVLLLPYADTSVCVCMCVQALFGLGDGKRRDYQRFASVIARRVCVVFFFTFIRTLIRKCPFARPLHDIAMFFLFFCMRALVYKGLCA